MRNTVKTLVFHRGAAGWSRLVGARKGVRFDAGGPWPLGGLFLARVYFFPGRERGRNKASRKETRDKRQKTRVDKWKKKEEQRKTSVVGQARTVGREKLPDGS